MYKILVYLKEGDLQPVGGPLGYNYNLKKGIEKLDFKGVEIKYIPGKSLNTEVNTFIKRIKSKKVKRFAEIIKSIYSKGKVLYGRRHISGIDFSEYSAIHFHTTYDMYKVKESLELYEGKVVLTTHTPTKPSKEIYDRLSLFEKKYLKKFYKKLDEIDLYAFTRATDIIFPCEEAEEPYFNNWGEFADIKKNNLHKFHYCPTGIIKKMYGLSRDEVRKKYKIPENAFVVCYVGRHAEIKGYDKLKIIGEKILNRDKNIYFLVAGKEEPLRGLGDKRWIEVGWTKDSGAIINASDIFLLPNKETYFDLVMLEILSLGQLVLTTKTGGNKYFEKIKAEGIFFYSTEEEAEKIILKMSNREHDYDEIRRKNMELFEERFTIDMFAKKYLEILYSILKNN